MSPSGITSPTATDGIADQYDHEIQLVDASVLLEAASSAESPGIQGHGSCTFSEQDARKKKGRGTIREEIARRKYAKYQEERYADDSDGESAKLQSGKRAPEGAEGSRSTYSKRERIRDRLRLRARKLAKAKRNEEYQIDVLYENQRGLFFCGIPLYSSKSLLNFDPSPWTAANFKDSPVNITNAQVPDPTWQWVWKAWYVDMSRDVDEEGWEYSFSFRESFSWHGTHPWFHSFVRRRRWLRKRVKLDPSLRGNMQDPMSLGHHLSQDYFTIHSARRGVDADEAFENLENTRSSWLSHASMDSDSDYPDEDLTDVNALLKAMRRTAVDRKKIDAFENFVEHAGDELYYLPEVMSEILSMLMYQNSRRHMLVALEKSLDRLSMSDEKPSSSQDMSDKRAEGLRRAADAVVENMKNLEYWSDVKLAENAIKGKGDDIITKESEESSTQESLEVAKKPNTNDINEMVSTVQIKGIPAEAELEVEPGIMRPLGFMREDSPETKRK